MYRYDVFEGYGDYDDLLLPEQDSDMDDWATEYLGDQENPTAMGADHE